MLWEWWQRYRRLMMIAGSLLFLGGSFLLYASDDKDQHGDWPLSPVTVHGKGLSEQEDSNTDVVQDEINTVAEPPTAPVPIYVDVKGQVKQPGLYTLETGMRVADAISLAGGTLPDADLDQINLAQALTDGVAIIIPPKAVLPIPDGQLPVRPLPGMLPPLPADSTGVTGAGISSAQTDNRVNLNTATVEELMTLPGIGQAKAQAIIAYRTEKNPFRTPEELKKISGIGEKVFARLKERIRVQ